LSEKPSGKKSARLDNIPEGGRMSDISLKCAAEGNRAGTQKDDRECLIVSRSATRWGGKARGLSSIRFQKGRRKEVYFHSFVRESRKKKKAETGPFHSEKIKVYHLEEGVRIRIRELIPRLP